MIAGENSSFEIIKAKNGLTTLKYHGDREVFLHSSFDPEMEGRRWAEGVDCQPDDTVIVLGIGLGYHIKALARRLTSGKIIAIEPHEELIASCNNYWVFKDLIAKNKVIILSSNQPAKNFLAGLVDPFHLEKVKIAEYYPLQRYFSREFIDVLKKVNDSLSHLFVSANTVLYFSRTWTQNFFANLDKVLTAVPADLFKNVFPNRPGIIVSAGPSLNKNIHLLKKAKGKAVIIVVGTALRPVTAIDVKPDIAVSLDGSEANYRHFQELSLPGFPLLFDAIIYPKILRGHQGPLIASVFYDTFSRWLINSGLQVPGQISIGPSVANMAFDFALKLGLDPIIFIGQDLAFSDGHTHARGTVYEKNKPTDDKANLLEIDGFDGGKVLTSRSLHSMLLYLETQIALTASGRNIINATEGGAKIAGTRAMTLNEAINLYCKDKFDPEEKIQAICSSYNPPGLDAMGKLMQKIKEEIGGLEKASKIARSGLRLANNLELLLRAKEPLQHKINKLLKRLDAVDKELKNLSAGLLPVDMAFQPVWFYLNKGAFVKEAEDQHTEGIRLAKKTQFLYHGLIESINIVKESMLQAAKNIDRGSE